MLYTNVNVTSSYILLIVNLNMFNIQRLLTNKMCSNLKCEEKNKGKTSKLKKKKTLKNTKGIA